jgi:CRP/FNR family transcriptional regulator, anaerobic regulatory protein
MRVPRGKALYRSGDKVESFYMIRSGCIKELDESSGRRTAMLINFALPGEMLSLQSLGCAFSNTTSIAVEPSFICRGPVGRIQPIVRRYAAHRHGAHSA